MMLRIGSKIRCSVLGARCSPITENREPKTDLGFTLIEIMVATAVLAGGIVLIYQSFFTSIGAYNYYSKYLIVQPWADQKIWQAQDELSHYGRMVYNLETSGVFQNKNSDFGWGLDILKVQDTKKFSLYKIGLQVSWPQGTKIMRLSREAYALYKKEKA